MMDVDLLIRLYYAKVPFKYVNANLAMFRMGGVTNSSYKGKLDEIRRLYTENGASNCWANFKVFYFSVYQRMAAVLRRWIKPDVLRKWKFRLHN